MKKSLLLIQTGNFSGWYQSDLNYPEAESMKSVYQRVCNFIHKLKTKETDKNILVVTMLESLEPLIGTLMELVILILPVKIVKYINR